MADLYMLGRLYDPSSYTATSRTMEEQGEFWHRRLFDCRESDTFVCDGGTFVPQ